MTDVRKNGTDPRATMGASEDADVRPVVALSRGGLPMWVLIAIPVLAGLLLFTILDARRRAATEPPETLPRTDMAATPAPPPPLVLPSAPQPLQMIPPPLMPFAAAAPIPRAPVPAPQPQVVYVPQQTPAPSEMPIIEVPVPARVSAEPALVVDSGAPRVIAAAGQGVESGAPSPPSASGESVAGSRARAGVLANRSTTVPQGTLIPAVLETALDSTRPGLARAIVSRDVHGFDGRQILIPRGSRLIGEYQSDTQPAQRRALINWLRLIRPDGVTISIASPAADPVGRGGIRARVNNHFFERFAGAILQSALDIGVNLAAREAGRDTVVILPGTQQQGGASQIVPQQQVTPTLSVRQGTSISIFVARDLDFSGASQR